MPTLHDLLKLTVALDGSDLHLSTRTPPQVRVHGAMRRLDFPDLTADDTRTLTYSVLTDAQQKRFEGALELDFSLAIANVARFRCNMFKQQGAVAAVYRQIPERPLTFAELGLPPVVAALADRPRGLLLVTGPSGSGKSTTLAAIVDKINRERRGHILTIEDPIEFVHAHKGCLVNQREIHRDTRSFRSALRAAVREDPDVVLIGEMRDRETIEAALTIAETGHLTFGTLHTSTAASTIGRIVDVFPAHQHQQVRTQLSLALEGVICQALLPTVRSDCRVLALEILVATPAVRHLIREDKVHQLYSLMQVGHGSAGMQTMNQSLAALCACGSISGDIALRHSSHRDELRELMARSRARGEG